MIPTKRTALVIDDDPFISELLRVILEGNEFDVDVASDGIHAVELARPYDVILLDLNMPVFDGERLTEYWGLTQPEILKRVIILSGYSRFTGDRRLPETFATIGKPFEHRALIQLVEQCAGQARD
ncbi:MAG: response regulator [Acidobacteriota bacterium]|nr:response regulator [Acidobacteriota bacterium]